MVGVRRCILPGLILSVVIPGCAKLVSAEGTESAAKTRARFIPQMIQDSGKGMGTPISARLGDAAGRRHLGVGAAQQTGKIGIARARYRGVPGRATGVAAGEGGTGDGGT